MSPKEVVEVSNQPLLLPDFVGASIAACGSNHSAFVVAGRLYTFGAGRDHQLGRKMPDDGSRESLGAEPGPVVFEERSRRRVSVVGVSLGTFHSAAITEDGALWTWGWGGSFWSGVGALGHGNSETMKVPTVVRRLLEDGEEATQVACGRSHTIVLTAEGRLYSTGKGEFGRLGHGHVRDESDFEEIEYFEQNFDSLLCPGEQATVVKVGVGHNFSAALSREGEIWVWGCNDCGQLGLGEGAVAKKDFAEYYPRLLRSLPMEGHRIVDFACGDYHIVALNAAGAIYEWGNRQWLEPHPVTLPNRYQEGLKDVVKVAAGRDVSFALTRGGELYSWGSKASGCLAQGPDCPGSLTLPKLVPHEVFDDQPVLDIAASRRRCLAITQA